MCRQFLRPNRWLVSRDLVHQLTPQALISYHLHKLRIMRQVHFMLHEPAITTYDRPLDASNRPKVCYFALQLFNRCSVLLYKLHLNVVLNCDYFVTHIRHSLLQIALFE